MKPIAFSNSIAIYTQNALRNKFNNLLASYGRKTKVFKGVLAYVNKMNKKFILPISLLLLVGLAIFVVAANWAAETNFDFDEGWNLVYGLASPDQFEGQVLEKQNIKAIYAFIPTTQQYARMYPNREDSKINIDDDFLVQTAFWVYTDKGTSGTEGEYWLYDSPKPYTERPVYKGWNFIGITPDMISDSAIESIKGNCNIEKSYFWVNEYQEWREYPLTSKFNDNKFVGFGWAIKVSNNCNLGNSEADIPSVPNLPSNSNQCSANQIFNPYSNQCVSNQVQCSPSQECLLLEGQQAIIEGLEFSLVSASEEQGYDKAQINVVGYGNANLDNSNANSRELEFEGYKILFESADGDKDKIMGASFEIWKI